MPLKRTTGLDLLAGTVVLDLTTSIAGPYAAQILGDMGATVIKVERPGRGDDARAWGPPFLDGESLWFMSVNRNKRSVTLDYVNEEGHAVLMDLVAKADIVILNISARAQRKLRLDAATLANVRPGLIHVSLTGFGVEGTRADAPCYDLIAEGYSGVMDVTGEPDGPPQKVGTPAADLLAGQDAAMAALAALLRRVRDQQGCVVDISMYESMTRFMAPRLMPFLGSGDVSRRSGGRDSVIAIYQVFQTGDEPMTLGLGNDAIWQRFWTAVGEPDAANHATYGSNAQRRERREEIVERIASILHTRPRAHWLDVLGAARVPCGPIHRLDEVAADEELHKRGFIYRVESGGRTIPQVGLGIRFDGETESCVYAPPKLGEHTQEILGHWLGLEPSAVDELRSKHII